MKRKVSKETRLSGGFYFKETLPRLIYGQIAQASTIWTMDINDD
jgi:hypothetical protein